jgi:type II secretory pathway pseudopilin PulG
MSGKANRGEAGYTLIALIATLAISMILMAAGVPSWRYLKKNSDEEELIFRGKQIADAIQRYQKKNGNALPPSLEVLVKGKFLRKAFKDPMTKEGKWRFLRPGEGIGAAPPMGIPGAPSTPTTTRPAGAPASLVGGTLGLIQGVASTSDEKSLRVVNGRTKYNEWIFLPGQVPVVGRPLGPVQPPGITPSGAPRASPTPLPPIGTR